MTVSLTTRFGMTRWSADTDAWSREQFDANVAAVEALGVVGVQGTAATRPAPSVPRRLYLSTDTGRVSIDSGTAWVDLATSAQVGSLSRIVGEIIMWPVPTLPSTDWLLLNGATFDAVAYPGLNTLLGGNVLPDYRGRVPVGQDPGQAEFDVLGEIGGAKTHALTVAELAAHGHAVSDPGHAHGVNDPGHSHPQNVTANTGIVGPGIRRDFATDGSSQVFPQGVNTDAVATGVGIAAAATGVGVASTGGGAAHNNLQPYRVSTFIIRAR